MYEFAMVVLPIGNNSLHTKLVLSNAVSAREVLASKGLDDMDGNTAFQAVPTEEAEKEMQPKASQFRLAIVDVPYHTQDTDLVAGVRVLEGKLGGEPISKITLLSTHRRSQMSIYAIEVSTESAFIKALEISETREIIMGEAHMVLAAASSSKVGRSDYHDPKQAQHVAEALQLGVTYDALH